MFTFEIFAFVLSLLLLLFDFAFHIVAHAGVWCGKVFLSGVIIKRVRSQPSNVLLDDTTSAISASELRR